jgi:Domain of Unknown Function (DUF928)
MLRSICRYTTVLAIIGGLWGSAVGAARLVSTTPKTTQRSRMRYKLPPPPPTGNPVVTSGAGSRSPSGDCPAVAIPLTALVPTAAEHNLVWGRTVETRPTVWIYLPYALTPHRPGELRLRTQDRAGHSTNQTIVHLTQADPGIVGIRFPPSQSLAPNQLYYWSFVVRCDRQDASANQFVKAAIQRIPRPAGSPPATDPNQTAAFAAAAGLWYDAITQLGELRRDRPQDPTVTANWTALLSDVGLARLAAQPIRPVP